MLTDIHFDPLTGENPHLVEQLVSAPVGKWRAILESSANQELSPDGADANYSLLASALGAARHSDVHYDYILLAGDLLAHNFPEKYGHYWGSDRSGYQHFAIKTMTFAYRLIQQTFPGIPIYVALGNNDSVTDDYAAQSRPLLAAMAKEWHVVAADSGARKDFLAGGYYAVPHPSVPSLRFIVLNTSHWSNKQKGDAAPGATDAGSVELKWLAAQLDSLQARHETAALLMHIPPGVDAYSSAKPGQCAVPTLFWKRKYQDSFLATIGAHKDVVRDGYAGHTHIDDFRVFTDTSGMAYFQTHIAPSIGRDHHNNPGFEIGVYDKSNGSLVDYAATYMRRSPVASASTDADWELAYDFRQESHFSSYSPATLQTIALLIRSSDAIRIRIMQLYGEAASSTTFPVSAKDWPFYSCAQTEIDPQAFSKCACPSAVPGN